MATPRSQRIGIWIIAIVLTVGTFGSFLAMVLGNQNKKVDQTNLQTAYSDYQAKSNVYNTKVAAQAKTLSDKYYGDFKQYSSTPAVFKADGIKTLDKKDLVVGDGSEITTKTGYSAYYIGWNPKGVVFDQSIDKDALKSPLTVAADTQMIVGWKEGVLGMKVGGVRELTIPSSMAYGAAGQGENIPANTPLKFIVMIIPKVDEIPQVQMPQILIDYYKTQQAGTQQQ
ncbi:MAG: FKBP-type peptidyl-prolyl cis-trans isomerase [Candidatus Saccharibacteria bacterium]|nr:FKBP-type peptidyl-prolyl cis-trans isomerase [Candidatus Saccharibacteria bacterium]